MNDEDEWGGWSIAGHPDEGSLYIGPVPERKQVALYLSHGNSSSVLAYFKDEDKARAATEWLDCVMANANACAGLVNKLLYGGVVQS